MICNYSFRILTLNDTFNKYRFTSGFADCCNVDRMKKKAKDEKKNFYCSYKSSDYFESCGKA